VRERLRLSGRLTAIQGYQIQYFVMSPAPTPICILDDDPSVLRSVQRLLESDGLTAHTFEKAGAFLDHARAHEVKLAILDLTLGDASGFDVQAALNEFSPGTQVIIVTGRGDSGLEATARQKGAHAFLHKPFEDDRFLRLVHHALHPAS